VVKFAAFVPRINRHFRQMLDIFFDKLILTALAGSSAFMPIHERSSFPSVV